MNRAQRALWGVLLGGLGLLLNLPVLELLPTVQLLLGPLCTLSAAVLLGGLGGAVAGAVAGARTVFLWGHPWGWLGAALEGAVVGRLSRRLPPVAAAALYWLFVAPVFFALTYVALAHIPARIVLPIALKQCVNSLLAMLIIQVALMLPAVRRRVRGLLPSPLVNVSLGTAVASALALGAIVPVCVVAGAEGRARYEAELLEMGRENAAVARLLAEEVEEQIAHARLATASLALRLERRSAEGVLLAPTDLQHELERLRDYSPELVSAFITDSEGRAIAFDPVLGRDGQPNIGVDFSARPYIREARTAKRAVVSDPFVGSRMGQEIFTVSSPIRSGERFRGAVVVSIDLRHLLEFARNRLIAPQRALVVGPRGQVVIDTDRALPMLSSVVGSPLQAAVEQSAAGATGTYFEQPDAFVIRRAETARHFAVGEIPSSGWKVIVEQPTAQLQRHVEASYAGLLGVVVVALGLVALGSIPLSQILVAPLRDVMRAADALASGDRAARTHRLAQDAPVELRELGQNFDRMAAQLGAQLESIEKASSEKDAFLSIASHELRTPLTALKVQVELIRRRLGLLHKERIDAIERQTDRIGRLVGQLLDAARLGSGQLPLDPVAVDLAELAREIAVTLVLASPGHSLELDVATTHGAWDELRLEQVLHNLVSNAIKYSPAGGPIGVKVRVVQDGCAEIVVEDRGIGIEDGEAAGLFERFARGSSPSVGRIAGLGVGLYVSREIVHRHGGTISLESREGGGTVATVRLPGAEPPGANRAVQSG